MRLINKQGVVIIAKWTKPPGEIFTANLELAFQVIWFTSSLYCALGNLQIEAPCACSQVAEFQTEKTPWMKVKKWTSPQKKEMTQIVCTKNPPPFWGRERVFKLHVLLRCLYPDFLFVHISTFAGFNYFAEGCSLSLATLPVLVSFSWMWQSDRKQVAKWLFSWDILIHCHWHQEVLLFHWLVVVWGASCLWTFRSLNLEICFWEE